MPKLRTKKRSLELATVGLLLATIGVARWGVRPLPHLAMPTKTDATSASQPLVVDAAAKVASPSATNTELWLKRLRRPLYDPPPPPPPPQQRPPPLRIELLGTIIEPDNSMAMVSSAGSVAYVRVGDRVGPAESQAEIIKIQRDAILLERGEERITLRQGEGEPR